MKSLLFYNIFQSLLASWYLADFFPISPLYADIFPFVFQYNCNGHGRFPVNCLRSVANDGAPMMRRRGVTLAAKQISRVCAKNCSGGQFIVTSQGPILSTILAPSPSGGLEGKLRRSCGSTTLQPRFRSGCWTNHVRLKRVPWVFRHELTQSHEYEWSLLSEHLIYWDEK